MLVVLSWVPLDCIGIFGAKLVRIENKKKEKGKIEEVGKKLLSGTVGRVRRPLECLLPNLCNFFYQCNFLDCWFFPPLLIEFCCECVV